MADYSHIRIKGEKRHQKRQRRKSKMKVSNRSIHTIADVIRKKEQDARR